MTRSIFLSEGSRLKSWARPKRGSTGAAGTLAVEKTEGAEEEPMVCEETEARRWEGEEVEGEDEDEVGEGAMMIFIWGNSIQVTRLDFLEAFTDECTVIITI